MPSERAPRRSTTLRTVIAAGALTLVATGCGGHTKAATSNGGGAALTPSSPRASALSSTAAAPSTGPTGVTGAKKCAASDTAAVIGGRSKCLHVGQQCSAKHAADYPTYGFTCDQKGTVYVLTKK